MRDVSQPPVEQEPEEGDPSPCTEDELEESFVRPDAARMEEEIGKFLDGLEARSAGALRKRTDSLQLFLCLLQRKAEK